MPQTVPTQHPAVVLRSHYRALRALLVVAMVAVTALSVAVVLLASDDDVTGAAPAAPAGAAVESADGPRYIHPPGQRYDNGAGAGAPLIVPARPGKPVPLPAHKLDGSTDRPPPEAADYPRSACLKSCSAHPRGGQTGPGGTYSIPVSPIWVVSAEAPPPSPREARVMGVQRWGCS